MHESKQFAKKARQFIEISDDDVPTTLTLKISFPSRTSIFTNSKLVASAPDLRPEWRCAPLAWEQKQAERSVKLFQ